MGFRVDFFQLYSISKSTEISCTTALLPDPVLRWLSVSVSSHHCWISSIISLRIQLTLMKRPNSWLARWLRCSASSFRRGSQLLGTSAQTRRNEIITKYQTDFLYASIVELSRWVITLPARYDDEFWGTTSAHNHCVGKLWPIFCF